MVLSILCSVHQVEGEIVIITMRRLQLSLSVIGYGHLVLRCAGSLCHRAVSRDLDAPSFWSSNRRKVYFCPVKVRFSKTNAVSTTAGRYNAFYTVQLFIQPNKVFCIRYLIITLCIYLSIQKLKNCDVSIWSGQNIVNLI